MITLPPKLYKQFETIYKMIKNGELRTLIPLLSLFELNGKPMGLENHFQLSPMFNVVQPQQMCMVLARQSGKSVSLSAASGIRSMLIPNYHQVIVQPMFEMIKRLNNTIYQPILRSCPIIGEFISPLELSKMTLKVFRNNSMTFMEHAFMSPDRLRGISGASACLCDESLVTKQLINLYDLEANTIKKTAVEDVKAGDVVLSFSASGDMLLLSVVRRDASYHGKRRCFRLTTLGRTTIECTADHMLPTNWGRLRVSDIIQSECNERSVYSWESPVIRVRSLDNVDAYETELIERIQTHKPAGDIALCIVGLHNLDFQDNAAKTAVLLDPICDIEYLGEEDVYDIEVEGTHNYIVGDGLCSYNCQDINWEFIPIIEECMSASINWGFSIYTGTPKTTDNTLSLIWNRSSQAEWVIRCDACGFFNVPNPEQHLLNMIGKHGPICAKCGKPVVIEHGGWVHGYPDRALTFPGYHLSQPIHKLHSINDLKWSRLVHKINTLPTVTLWNECYGWPYDDATSPLTLSDLINAEFDPLDRYGTKITIKNPEDVQRVAHNYSYITIGCDWGGGSAISDSYTAFAVVGLRRDNQVMDVLYYERIPKGVSPTDEARILMSWIRGTRAKAFTFDNGGAGFVRTEMMKHEGLSDIAGLKVIPQQYGPPRGGDVMRLAKAQRETDLTYYVTDKSRSLAMCIAGIKAQRVRIPHFNHEDENDPIRDFLALIEDPRDIRGRDVVILIGRKAGRPDDLAHAVNFACCQIGDAFGAYLPIGRKYDTSKLEPLDADEENDLVYGPRGDFDRFQDAISANCSIVEPDYDYY